MKQETFTLPSGLEVIDGRIQGLQPLESGFEIENIKLNLQVGDLVVLRDHGITF